MYMYFLGDLVYLITEADDIIELEMRYFVSNLKSIFPYAPRTANSTNQQGATQAVTV